MEVGEKTLWATHTAHPEAVARATASGRARPSQTPRREAQRAPRGRDMNCGAG